MMLLNIQLRPEKMNSIMAPYIGTIPILLFKNQFRDFEEGVPIMCTYGEAVNLSLEDYKKALLQKNRNHGVDLVEF
jgi:hypothetical protein